MYDNIVPTIMLAIALCVPFLYFSTANFFHKDGFVDKVSSFASVLTGFYVAGLVAVAAFSPAMGSVDDKIEEGRVILRGEDGDLDHDLTRREYACYLFGYLALLSLVISLVGITTVIISSSFAIQPIIFRVSKVSVDIPVAFIRGVGIIFTSFVLSHMFIVTVQGLYYLTERLYAKKAETLPDGNQELSSQAEPGEPRSEV